MRPSPHRFGIVVSMPISLPLKIDTLAPRQPSWWVMLGMLAVLMVPLCTALSKHATTHTMEYVAVLSSQETWLRMHGEGDRPPVADAWLIPYLNARPRVTKPPMTVWMNLLAWSDLEPPHTSAQTLVLRARMVTVALAALTILATFWIGCVLRDRWLGLLAAAVLGSMFMFQLQARTASYDIHFVAWATLSIACATWAINPSGPAPGTRRMMIGWGLAGVLLAISTLCKGPLACAVTAVPVLVMTGLLRNRWKSVVQGLLLMAVITAVLVLPWYVYAQSHVPTATKTWSSEYLPTRSEYQPPWYYLLLLVLVLPWTLWLIGGLCQPFIRANGEARRQRLVAWGWLIAMLAMFSIPGAKQNRYILPLFPAAALVIAQLWRDHQAQADAGEVDRGVNVLRLPHWATIIVMSIALPVFIYMQPAMREPQFDHVSTLPLIVFGISLLGLGCFGWWQHRAWKPHAAALVTTGWMAVCMTLIWMAYPSGATEYVEAGRHMHRVVGDASLGFLMLDEADDKSFRECEPFRLYLVRIAWPTTLDDLSQTPPTLLLARNDLWHTVLLLAVDYKPVENVLADRDLELTLWRHSSD